MPRAPGLRRERHAVEQEKDPPIKRETLELVRAYYKIRRNMDRFCGLVRSSVRRSSAGTPPILPDVVLGKANRRVRAE